MQTYESHQQPLPLLFSGIQKIASNAYEGHGHTAQLQPQTGICETCRYTYQLLSLKNKTLAFAAIFHKHPGQVCHLLK